MNIAVMGLGYVGVVTGACLARDGHNIVGVDIDPYKVDLLNRGRSPIIEDQIDDLVADATRAGRLRATTCCNEAIAATDMAIICVGTPSLPGGGLDSAHVEKVSADIGRALGSRAGSYTVVVRSTVMPGTVRSLVIPAIEAGAGQAAAENVDVVFHPEFLREGSSVQDFYEPPKIVVGERSPGAGRQVLDLYDGIEAPRFVTSLEIAETVKYCDNLFHALKVTFANEIGQFCQAVGVDSTKVMDIFCQDTKLNISSKYLKPGFAFGGSCLPKDLRAFLSMARQKDLTLPMLEHVLPSNAAQIERALRQVLEGGARTIGFYGLSFKPGTDDLRESPLVELAERLIGKGAHLTCYDEHVRIAKLVGGNRAYVERVLPHLAELLVEDPQPLSECELVIVGHPAPEALMEDWLERGIAIYDLGAGSNGLQHENYRRVV